MNIKNLQDHGQEILKDVTDAFEQNGIKYFLAYGTQLGATRHKDVIPWDYDFDIGCFLRDEQQIYDVLNKLDKYDVVYNHHTSDNKTMASIMIYEKTKTKYYRENNVGMYLDVFLFDFAPKQTPLVKMLYKLLFLKYSMKRKVTYFGFANLFKVLRLENFSFIKALIFIIAYLIVSLFTPLIYLVLNSKKEKDIFTYSNKANIFGLGVDKFVYPDELINGKLTKTAKIGDNYYYEFENVEKYLNMAFSKKWRQPISEKQIKTQILTKFPKVITEKKEIK